MSWKSQMTLNDAESRVAELIGAMAAQKKLPLLKVGSCSRRKLSTARAS